MIALVWVASYDNQRLLEPLGYLPPAEYEAQYYTAQITPVAAGALN